MHDSKRFLNMFDITVLYFGEIRERLISE
jgi:hypothetical protein